MLDGAAVPPGTPVVIDFEPVFFAEARTVLFTSHALADVAELCDRVAVIHAGTLRYLGTPAALCAQYSCSDLEQACLRCIDGAAQPA